jgi:hypothetical protein
MMKVRRKSDENDPAERCRGLIVSIWRELGNPAVGASELTHVHQALAGVFGPDQLPSPARIARELAQQGATLRHPEIIETDARWRESQMAGQLNAFQSLRLLDAGAPLTFNQAAAVVAELAELRGRFVDSGDDVTLDDLKTLAIEARQTAKNRGKDPSLSAADREMQREISEWFRVWLETPNLFEQWLELRRSSAAFKEKFDEFG